jgi:hypothetical protein
MIHEEIKVTRRDMVRAEIDSAIDLLLALDFVSAHVLAFSAKAVLRGVAKARGIETIDEVFEDYIKPEHLKDWREAITESYNVFKHANNDPDRELDKFRPETTVIAIFTACVNYGLVYKQWSFPMLLFRSWFFCRHPNFAKPPFDETVETWKPNFGHPEGKPLSEAMKPMDEMIAAFRQNREHVFARLTPEAAEKIER